MRRRQLALLARSCPSRVLFWRGACGITCGCLVSFADRTERETRSKVPGRSRLEPTRAPPPPAPARRGARVLSYVNTALRERPNDVDRTAQLSSTSDLEPPLSSRGPDSDLRVRENACPCTPVHAARARTTIPRSALNPCDAARPASKNLTMQHHPLTRCPTGAYTRRRACQAKLGEVFTSPDPLTALS